MEATHDCPQGEVHDPVEEESGGDAPPLAVPLEGEINPGEVNDRAHQTSLSITLERSDLKTN